MQHQQISAQCKFDNFVSFVYWIDEFWIKYEQ